MGSGSEEASTCLSEIARACGHDLWKIGERRERVVGSNCADRITAASFNLTLQRL